MAKQSQVKIISVQDTQSIWLDNRGLAYGDGFFSTMGVSQGQILWRDYHLQRLHSHAQALSLDVDAEDIMQQLDAYANALQASDDSSDSDTHRKEGILKLLICRKPQNVRGYAYNNGKITAFVNCLPMCLYDNLPNVAGIPLQPKGDAICLQAQIACLPKPLVGLKTLNRLDNVLCAGELERLKKLHEGCLLEGLVADVNGNWVEGVMSNVFYQLDAEATHSSQSNQWYTPPMTQSGVSGVMRQVIIDKLAHTAHPVIKRHLTDADLPNLQRLFFCNAVRGIMPIDKLWFNVQLIEQTASKHRQMMPFTKFLSSRYQQK